jgi:hypothetical protein
MYKGFLAGLALGCIAAIGSSPDPHELMTQSVKVAEANWSEAPNYSFIRTEAKSKHQSAAVTAAHEVLMIEGSPYRKMVSEDGRVLSSSRAQEEEQKLQKERAKRAGESARERRKRLEKYAEERNRDHAMLMELAEAFDYIVTGEQHSGEDPVWLLDGKPKPGYIPRDREARVLAHMNVKFWIDQATYQWLRVEAEVMQPVSLYGAIAKVAPGTRFVLEQEPVSPNLWLPKRFSMQIKASALGFINEDSVEDESYTDYRRWSPAVNAMKNADDREKARTGFQ